MVSCQETSPFEREQTLFAKSPPCRSAGECTLLCIHGGGGKILPLPQCCTLPAHEVATLPLSLLPLLWPLPLQSPLLSLSPSPSPSPSLSPSPLPLPSPLPSLSPLLSPLLFLLPLPIAVAVAIGRYCCGCHCPLPPPSLSRCHQPLPLPSPLPSAIAISITVGHCRCHLHQPSSLPSPLAIAKSCCLGAARILFKQLKQIMLTLFYFVQTVGSALIKARWLTRRWVAMANTNVGQRAASSKRLVGEVAGSRGQQGGDVAWPWEVFFLCCWATSHWQMAFAMMCWMW